MTKTKTTICAMIFAVTAIGLLASTVSVSNSANAQSTATVPSWIQNVAGFWSNGEIPDEEFVNAMTFLVEEGIMDLPNTVSTAEAQTITSSLEEINDRLEQIETQQATSGTTIAAPPTIPGETTDPLEDTRYSYTFAVCPADKIRHFDKIQFKLNLDKSVNSVKGHPSISSIENNIIILEEDSEKIGIPFRLESRVAQELTDLGYSHLVNNISTDVFQSNIVIIDVEYAIVCANKPGASGTGDTLGFK